MKKSLPHKKAIKAAKVVKAATTRKKKVTPSEKSDAKISCVSPPVTKKAKKASKKASVSKTQKHSATSANNAKKSVDTLPLNPSVSPSFPQPQSSLSENNPPMISLKDCTDQESLTHFEEPVAYRVQKHKKGSRKKSRRSKTVRNRSFYGSDEDVDFELEDQEFLDDELVSLDEFDSILNETKGKAFPVQNIEEEDDHGAIAHIDLRQDSSHSLGADKTTRRKKVQRRRQIDPTTCERDYTTDEVEFMTALDDYKRNSGRMFPTCSEILEVLRDLGYAKAAATPPPPSPPPAVPIVQEQTATELAEISGTQIFTLTVDNFTTEIPSTITAVGLEHNLECLSFLLNDSPPVVGMLILPDLFST